MNFGGPIDLTPFGDLVRGIGLLYWAIALAAACLALWVPKRWRVKLPLALLVLCGFILPVATRVHQMKQAQDNRQAKLDESMALFKEQCKTSGEKIIRTVENVEGVVWMKWREPISNADNFADQFKLNDPYGQDCGAEDCVAQLLRVTQGAHLKPGEAKPRAGGYRFVETIHPRDGVRYRYTAVIKSVKQRTPDEIAQYKRNTGQDPGPDVYGLALEKEPINAYTARYGITWDDISTREDREHWIAGGSLKIIDLQTNEVIAERRGYMVDRGQGSQAGFRSPWVEAQQTACPQFTNGNSNSRRHRRDENRQFSFRVLDPIKGE